MDRLTKWGSSNPLTGETRIIVTGVRAEIVRLIANKVGNDAVPSSVVNKIMRIPDKIDVTVHCHEEDDFCPIEGNKIAARRIKKIFDGYYREVLLVYFKDNQHKFYRLIKQLTGNGYPYDKLKKVIRKIIGMDE